MERIQEAHRRMGQRSSSMINCKRKHETHNKTTEIESLFAQNKNNTEPVKKEIKLDPVPREVTNNRDTVEKQSKMFSTDKNSNVKVKKTDKSTVTLTRYLLGNVSIASNVIQQRSEISNAEEFKTDETPVAVPVHGTSTPHRINMRSEDLESSTITTIEKPPVITLLSPLQVIKKPAPRRRKKAADQPGKQIRSSKTPPVTGTNHSITDYFPVRRSLRKSKKTVLEEKQRDLENKVLRQIEEGLEIRHFVGKGRGVTTTREFTKGEFVVEYIGELINQVEAKIRENIYTQDQNIGCYMYYFQYRNQQYCIDATADNGKLGRLVNHSRNGNLITRIVEVNSIPHLVLIAKENIPVGVEISYDYGDRSRESIRNHPWLAL